LRVNVELTGDFAVITGMERLVIMVKSPVERLVPEARSGEEPNGRPRTGQLDIPVVRSATGISIFSPVPLDEPLISNWYHNIWHNLHQPTWRRKVTCSIIKPVVLILAQK